MDEEGGKAKATYPEAGQKGKSDLPIQGTTEGISDRGWI